MLEESFAISQQLTDKPALRSHQHSLPRRNKARMVISFTVAAQWCLEGLQQSRATRSPAVADTCPLASPGVCQWWHLKLTVRSHSLEQAGGQSGSDMAGQPCAPHSCSLLEVLPSGLGEGQGDCAWQCLEHNHEDSSAPKLSSYCVDSSNSHSALAQRESRWRGGKPLCQHRNLRRGTAGVCDNCRASAG